MWLTRPHRTTYGIQTVPIPDVARAHGHHRRGGVAGVAPGRGAGRPAPPGPARPAPDDHRPLHRLCDGPGRRHTEDADRAAARASRRRAQPRSPVHAAHTIGPVQWEVCDRTAYATMLRAWHRAAVLLGSTTIHTEA